MKFIKTLHLIQNIYTFFLNHMSLLTENHNHPRKGKISFQKVKLTEVYIIMEFTKYCGVLGFIVAHNYGALSRQCIPLFDELGALRIVVSGVVWPRISDHSIHGLTIEKGHCGLTTDREIGWR